MFILTRDNTVVSKVSLLNLIISQCLSIGINVSQSLSTFSNVSWCLSIEKLCMIICLNYLFFNGRTEWVVLFSTEEEGKNRWNKTEKKGEKWRKTEYKGSKSFFIHFSPFFFLWKQVQEDLQMRSYISYICYL